MNEWAPVIKIATAGAGIWFLNWLRKRSSLTATSVFMVVFLILLVFAIL